MNEKRCLICGDLFIPTRSTQKYCNKLVLKKCKVCGEEFAAKCAPGQLSVCSKPECKEAARNGVSNNLPPRICRQCGEEFKPTNVKQHYCNQEKSKSCPICSKLITYKCGPFVKETCSVHCQAQYVKQKRNASAQLLTKKCKWCGKEFHPKEVREEYCEGPHYQTCAICGKKFEIDVKRHPDTSTCSKECMGKLMSQNHDYIKGAATHKANLFKKYGVTNSMRIPGIVEHLKQANLDRYGAEWYTQTDEYRDRVQQTCLDKYGVDHHLKAESIIQKRKHTVKQKYNTDNVFKNEKVKCKIRQTMLKKYGVEYPAQSPQIRAKAAKTARVSGLEQRICLLLDNYGIAYIHRYMLSSRGYSHEFDFYLPQYKMLIDADGIYFHSYLEDPDGEKIREDYDDVRLYLVPEDHRFHVIVEGTEEQQLKQLVDLIERCAGSLSDYDSAIFEWCRSISFPYPNYTSERLNNDWKHLQSYKNDKYVPQCRIGQSLIKQFHKSIYKCHVGNNLSPYEGWYNDDKLKQVIRNRLIYINRIDPSKVLAGFNISKTCPCVSTFNPILARYLTLKYLADYSSVFDPFSGFSGRLLGVASVGLRYLGHDLNEVAVAESNEIIRFLHLDPHCYSVTQRDIFDSSGTYECLLTCPPYGTKEKYNSETVFQTCDEWIKECLDRFKCNRYVFVVDETADFSEYVTEEITSASHFAKVTEKVVVITK